MHQFPFSARTRVPPGPLVPASLGILAVALFAESGCSRPDETAPAVATVEAVPDVQITFQQVYALVADETIPAADLTELFATLDKATVEWDGYLLEESSPENFLLGPDRKSRGGILMFPPKGWAQILRDLNHLTPLRVRGTLECGYHGLRLNVAEIALREEAVQP